MKKVSLIAALLLLTVFPLFGEHVDPETARKVATTFLSNNGAKADQLTDLSKAAGFTNLYIFNGEEGFVVMAADDCAKPILGYSLTGKFEVEGMPENLRWWLQGYDDQIQDAINNNYSIDSNACDKWLDLKTGNGTRSITEVVVGPLVNTVWKQQAPFNNLCPEYTVTGCVATAMAQVMKKWGYPETGIGSHSYYWNGDTYSADFGNTEYAWANMLNDYSVSYSTEQANAVATLMYHCGVAVEMKYLANQESGSTIQRAGCALSSYFNYTSTYIQKANFADNDAWISRITDDLDHGMPVLYGGSYPNKDGGHAFVCDGYDSDSLLHFNWGWGPGSNGYYSVNGHSFTRAQNAVVNIKPIDCQAGKPSNLSGSNPSGHRVILSWVAGSNAVSYNIYCNNTLIGNSTTTSFIHDNPTIGSNCYYIRSLDSNNNLSLPSSTISVNVSFTIPTVNHLKAQYNENQTIVSWPTPWWHPENNVGILAYTDEERPEKDSYIFWEEDNIHLYWGIRHLATDLTSLQGKALYKTTFYVFYPGNYKVLVYQGTNTEEEDDLPANLVAEKSINTAAIGWVEAAFDDPIFIDDQDLWVFVYDIDGKFLWIPCNDNNNCNGLGQYYAGDYGDEYPLLPHEACHQLPTNSFKVDWFIRSYLTDGIYTYNLYDGTTKVNGDVPISGTSYSITEPLSEGVHQFTVKTNYSGGESAASNKAGVTIGASSLETLVLDADDAMILTSGSTLTVSGTITNTDPAHLIIEDGGQLITSNAVYATVKKDINAAQNWGNETTYTPDGWYFIASPVDGFATSNIVSGTETTDLYSYNEASGEWWNAQNTAANNHAFTTLARNQGYLYANNTGQDLEFAGEMQATNTTNIEKTLSFEGNGSIKGFNLLGNPFTCNLNSGDVKISDTAITVYYTVEGGSEIVARGIADNPIKPGRGFMVQAKADNQKIVFHPSTTRDDGTVETTCIRIEAGDNSFIDCAYIQIGGGNTLRKMSLSDNVPHVYVMQDGKDYAAATLQEDQHEIPVNFKAAHNGTYTLTVSTPLTSNLLPLTSLHLIDNLTGTNIDLLQQPTYTFEAKVDDYESRFRLLLNPINNPNNDSYDIEGGVIQILDMTGRFVGTDRNQLAPGVYIVRTINGNETKTEKIVVR